MTTAFKDNYAPGIRVTSDKRVKYSHGGGIDGFNPHLVYYPQTEITVVALANLNGSAPEGITSKLGALAVGERITLLSERKEIRVPRRGNLRALAIQSQRDARWGSAPDATERPSAYACVRRVQDSILCQSGRHPVEFLRSGGKVTHAVMCRGDGERKAVRISDAVAAAPAE